MSHNTHKKILQYSAGKNVKGSIKLSSNESAFPPSLAVRNALRTALPKAHVYPDTQHSDLKTRIAKHNKHAVLGTNIILGNGSDEILSLIAQCFLTRADGVLINRNTFSVYSIVSQIAGAKINYVKFPYISKDIFLLQTHILKNTRMVFVCNPNNPTGIAYFAKDIYRFASLLPKNCYLVLDEAYIDFAKSTYAVNPHTLFQQHANTIVLRTFSKAFALGGLRIGYGIAPHDIIKKLEELKMPFNINSLASTAAYASLQDMDSYKKNVSHVKEERNIMCEFFKKKSIIFFESHANFLCVDARTVLFNSAKKENAAERMYNIFAQQKIIIRSLASFGMPNHVRITVGTKSQNKQVRAVFTKILTGII